MCGIAGKLNFDSQKAVSRELIEKMTHTLEHRGPDDEGFYCKGNIGLGHRRLSIIDLSPAGHQPMSNAAGTVWIVFNGEIYNHQALRKELGKEGVQFRSRSDTEVILALYERNGVDCLKHLSGMFAFALWDEVRQRLFLARDRVGKKPLKYALTPNEIVFASEVKAILKDHEISKEVDDEALHHYLSLQYVPAPRTGFKAIKKLPPAHYLLWEKGKVTVQRYWRLEFEPKQILNKQEWEEGLYERLRKAVRLRMISDVPIGLFLSGGIDSSIIAGLMAEQSLVPIKTFSIGFTNKRDNELPYAGAVAKTLGTDHHSWTLEFDTLMHLQELAKTYDEPFADPAALPTYLMSREVKRHVTVVLNGDGGDELIASYRSYHAYRWDHTWAKVPFLFRWMAYHLSAIGAPFNKSLEKLQRFLAHPERSPEERWLQDICFLTEDQKEALYTEEFKQRTISTPTRKWLAEELNAVKLSPLDQAIHVDIENHLAENLLAKVDFATMAHGVESRSPFLDHEVMEWMARMPVELKMHGSLQKEFFKKTFKKELPSLIQQRHKHAFDVPLDEWFRKVDESWLRDKILSPRLEERGLFKRNILEYWINAHRGGKARLGRQLWTLLMLELWFQHHVD